MTNLIQTALGETSVTGPRHSVRFHFAALVIYALALSAFALVVR